MCQELTLQLVKPEWMTAEQIYDTHKKVHPDYEVGINSIRQNLSKLAKSKFIKQKKLYGSKKKYYVYKK